MNVPPYDSNEREKKNMSNFPNIIRAKSMRFQLKNDLRPPPAHSDISRDGSRAQKSELIWSPKSKKNVKITHDMSSLVADSSSSHEDDEDSVGDESTNLQHAKKMRGQYRMKVNQVANNQITGVIPTTSAKKINMRKMKSFEADQL